MMIIELNADDLAELDAFIDSVKFADIFDKMAHK
jgi:hypothetical protein